MPAQSKQQQKFMGIVRAIQKGDQPASKFSKKAQDAADDMKKKDVEKFASTKHKGLPKKVEQALREKIKSMVEDYVESCGYVMSAEDPNYKLKSPGGTGEEDRELKEVHKMKGAQGKMVVVPDNYVARYGKVQYNLMKKLGYTGGDHNIIRHMDFGYQNYHRQKPNDQFSSSIILKSYPKGDFGDKDGRIRKKDVMVVLKELMRQLKANRLKLDKKPVYRPDVNNPMIEFRVDPKSVVKESVNEKYKKLHPKEKIIVNFRNKKKGFKPDKKVFNDYEKAVKWGRKNVAKFHSDMISFEIPESVNENTTYKVGDTISYWTIGRIDKGKAKVKGVTKARPNRLGIKNHYITNKGTFSDMEVVGTEAYKLRFKGNTEKKVMKAMGVKEGFGSDEFLTKTEKKKFEKERLENAEVLGYTLTGTKDLKESINEVSVSQVRSTLSRVKKQLMKKWAKKGGYENFGQKELRKMKDKLDYNPYGSPQERQISKMLDAFNDWAMNYSGDMRESVNESKKEKDQIIKYLQGLGFNERTAKNAVAKSYNYISKAYRNTGTRYKGDLIARILTKKESVFAVRQDKIKNGERFPKEPNFDYDPEKSKSRIRKVNESMSPSQIKKMRDEFEKTGQLPPHLKKFALDLKILKKKHKVKDIVVPGLEWMSDMKEVNEGKGVEKVLKMANDHSFGKLGGRTVDALSAGLFKGVYDKASQNAKDKINKMNEKQLYVFMTKLWSKFGKQVKIS